MFPLLQFHFLPLITPVRRFFMLQKLNSVFVLRVFLQTYPHEGYIKGRPYFKSL